MACCTCSIFSRKLVNRPAKFRVSIAQLSLSGPKLTIKVPGCLLVSSVAQPCASSLVLSGSSGSVLLQVAGCSSRMVTELTHFAVARSSRAMSRHGAARKWLAVRAFEFDSLRSQDSLTVVSTLDVIWARRVGFYRDMTKLRATFTLGQNHQLLVKLSDLQLTRALSGATHWAPPRLCAWAGVNGLRYRPNGTH